MTPPIRSAALYARFSSELQHERSIDDQLALARAYCHRNGLTVAAEYSDRARSGASVVGREGLQQLMHDARAGRFTVVVVEALDRLSRDQEDLAGIWKRLQFVGIELVGVHDGAANAVQVGVRGLVGALYLEDLAHKTRRGLAGVVAAGRHAGGRAYGYRTVPGQPGRMTIDDDEAAVVRRIFAEYLDGRPPREIAARLNADGVAPPRGQTWNASTINGNRARGHGILLNELYAGRIVWNRVRMIKDPDTGRRLSRVNPESEWLRTDAPELRIVDEQTFAAAQTRKAARSSESRQKRQRPRHLLSGLLRCGACGSGMHVHDNDRGRQRVRCARCSESGDCINTRRYYLDTIQRTVTQGLCELMDSPDALAAYVEEYHAEMRRLTANARRDAARTERRLAEVRRTLERLVDMLVDGSATMRTIGERMAALEAERTELEQRLEATAGDETNVVRLHPGVVEQYRRDLRAVEAGLSGAFAEGDVVAIAAFRRLVETVTVAPSPAGAPLRIRVRGRLGALLDRDVFPDGEYAGGAGGRGGGTRFEPSLVADQLVTPHPVQCSRTWSQDARLGRTRFVLKPTRGS